ncbi:MAG: hypothetical protein ABJF01_05640 [bacterium]
MTARPDHRPPRLAQAFAESLIGDADLRDAVVGDLAEDYARLAGDRSPAIAAVWYCSQLVRSTASLSALGLSRGVTPWILLIVSVVVGYAVLAVTVLFTDLWMLSRFSGGASAAWVMAVLSLITGAACAMLGGFVAASIGRRAPIASGVLLGTVCVAISGVIVAHGGDGSPMWYQIVLMVIVGPSAAVGALARALRLARRHH